MGLFALLQAWLALLDAGMTPTLGREMARFTAGQQSPQAIRDLLRTLECVCIGMAILIAVVVWASSGWLASDWLKVDKLPIDAVQRAISIMALLVALRFVENIYKSALFGLQRQVWTNGVNAALATLRGVGAVLILAAVSPTIEAFFLVAGAHLRAVGGVPGHRRSSDLAPWAATRRFLACHAATGLALCRRHDGHHAAGAAARRRSTSCCCPACSHCRTSATTLWRPWWQARCTC